MSSRPDNVVTKEEEETSHPWEAQVGWTYIGHREWVQLDTDDTARGHNNQLHMEPMWVQKWLEKNDKDIALHMAVTRGGYPNRWGAKQEVKSRWNLQKFEAWLTEYEDKEVVEWL